jgi:hypothetical protein
MTEKIEFSPFVCTRCGTVSFDGKPHACDPRREKVSFYSQRISKCKKCSLSFKNKCTDDENKPIKDKCVDFYDKCPQNFWLPVILRCDSCENTVINVSENLKVCPFCGFPIEQPEENTELIKKKSDHKIFDFDFLTYVHLSQQDKNQQFGPLADHIVYDDSEIKLSEFTERPKAELIVAFYNENIHWLNHVPDNIDLITVYRKSDNEEIENIKCNDNRIQVIDLKNTGREAHTWLYHFISRRNTLADITYLAQGNPFEHSPDYLDLISFNYTEPTTLTIQYKINSSYELLYENKTMRDLDQIIKLDNGLEVRKGLIVTDKKKAIKNRHNLFFSKNVLRIWNTIFKSEIPNPFWFGYSAMYALPQKDILMRSDKFYKKLITSNINGFQFEGLWNYIFDSEIESIWE